MFLLLTTNIFYRTANSIFENWFTAGNFQLAFLNHTGSVVANAIAEIARFCRVVGDLKEKSI